MVEKLEVALKVSHMKQEFLENCLKIEMEKALRLEAENELSGSSRQRRLQPGAKSFPFRERRVASYSALCALEDLRVVRCRQSPVSGTQIRDSLMVFHRASGGV